ncbi:MAG: SDR family NAD(P)-dependent oxidoreductase [Proteobacteria bacterium]|nr:SDR family NAD(P)-dependent oxidoreductase [Pseudomonadota bacterium]
MAFRSQDKVALVTGGGTGIGAATAVRFAQEGATVVVFGRRRDPLDAVVASIVAVGGKAEAGFTGALPDCAARRGQPDELVSAPLF